MVPAAVVVALAIAALVVVGLVRKERACAAAQEQALIRNGFSRCDGDAPQLETVVRLLRNSSEFEVHRPWKRQVDDTVVYRYEVSREDAESTQRILDDEFLCTLKRPSEQPILLYLSPATLGKGIGAQLIEKLLVITAPRGLEKLDPSASAHSASILAAFGPPGVPLGDLVDPEQLALFARGARHGIFAIRCHGEHCALELFGAYARRAMEPIRWEETWSFVRQVVGSSTARTSSHSSSRDVPQAIPR